MINEKIIYIKQSMKLKSVEMKVDLYTLQLSIASALCMCQRN